jgi:DNA-nicking Smr family endonuclease
MTASRGRDDAGLWSIVAATVRPLRGRVPWKTAPASAAVSTASSLSPPPALPRVPAPNRAPRGAVAAPRAPEPIEPNRRRRLDLGREPKAATLDLHGLGRDEARARLVALVQRLAAENARALLVITGKGVANQGVLRRAVPEWLAEPPLRDLVAGISEAHPRRGGAGALYVVLRRKQA